MSARRSRASAPSVAVERAHADGGDGTVGEESGARITPAGREESSLGGLRMVGEGTAFWMPRPVGSPGGHTISAQLVADRVGDALPRRERRSPGPAVSSPDEVPMSASFVLSARGSVTLPHDVREGMGLKPGQRFVAVPKGSVVMLVPVEDVAALRGTARGADTSSYRDKSER